MATPEEILALLQNPHAPLAAYNLVTLDSLSTEQGRSGIPSLQAALETWHESGDMGLLIARAQTLERAQIPIPVLTYTYSLCHEEKLPLAIVAHTASFSAEEKARILAGEQHQLEAQPGTSGPVTPVKTLSIKIKAQTGPRYVLFTGVGDFQIGQQEEDQLAELLGVSQKAVKKGKTINPPELDTTLALGLIPGIVGPFFEHHHLLPELAKLFPSISEVIYLENPTPPDALVGIAVSPIDTLVVQKATFEHLLEWWSQEGTLFAQDLLRFLSTGQILTDRTPQHAGYIVGVARMLMSLSGLKGAIGEFPPPEPA